LRYERRQRDAACDDLRYSSRRPRHGEQDVMSRHAASKESPLRLAAWAAVPECFVAGPLNSAGRVSTPAQKFSGAGSHARVPDGVGAASAKFLPSRITL